MNRSPREVSALNEKPLHAALKEWYAQAEDRLEVAVDGYIIDIVRDDLLIEVQTRNFAALKHKLIRLTAHHPVRIVYPIAQEKWIVRLAHDGQGTLSRRRSPKRGTLDQVFHELVRLPHLFATGNFSLHVLLIQEEELRRYDRKKGWRRRGWVTHERRLLQVLDQRLFAAPVDVAALLPSTLDETFSAADLASAMDRSIRLAGRMAYCLREMGAIQRVGKRGNALLYARTERRP